MKKISAVLAVVLLCGSLSAQDYSWESVPVDGSMTGCTAPARNNIEESTGYIRNGKYHAPSGKVYGRRTSTSRTAAIVLAAQPEMARVKEVIGYSSRAMEVSYPESALSNWFVDLLMAKVENLSGKKIHIGVTNFGGIRVDMPKGDIILDDMLSMFPFKNQLVYVEHTGKQIKSILDSMAAGRFQVLGGVRVVAEDGKIISAEIDGEPIQDDKIYGLATISFLLSGGDGLSMGDNAVSMTVYDDVDIIDAVLEYVNEETAAGRPIEYEKDGRVVIKDMEDKR